MKICFVVQGFGKKTDFTDGRVLDLDASYAIIKEAVEAAGLQCVRADEIQHAGTIDVPMYRHLLEADLVIADLSTYNVNAAFELGVRYGLRPRATIIVAEEGFKNPFDVSHNVIRRYKHLGEDIGAKEARRFRDELKLAIAEIMAKTDIDSPVYTYLSDLLPPQAPPPRMAAARTPPGSADNLRSVAFAKSLTDADDAVPAQNPMELREAAKASMRANEFAGARDLLLKLRELRPNDNGVVQQLALATYKSRLPTREEALAAARDILLALQPATSNDPETLGLWGSIHKQLWEGAHQLADLAESIDAYGRGFHLKQDYYNGINYAFLLEQRALAALRAGERDEGIADAVLARRVRKEVIKYALPLLDTEDVQADAEKRFWILATLWQATRAAGDPAAAQWESQARALDVADWMLATTLDQIQAGEKIQAEIASLSAQQ